MTMKMIGCSWIVLEHSNPVFACPAARDPRSFIHQPPTFDLAGRLSVVGGKPCKNPVRHYDRQAGASFDLACLWLEENPARTPCVIMTAYVHYKCYEYATRTRRQPATCHRPFPVMFVVPSNLFFGQRDSDLQ
jgi:hypothetical protein